MHYFFYQFRKFLVGTNLWVGLAAGSFTALSFDRPLSAASLEYSLLVVLGLAVAYNYMRWIQVRQSRGNTQVLSYRWWLHSSWLPGLILGLLTGLVIVLLYDSFTWQQWFWLLPPGVVAALYPLLWRKPLQAFTSLRDIPFLKVILISASWAYVTYWVPQWLQMKDIDIRHYLEAGLRLLLVIGLVIPFDLRDLKYDAPQLRTLPQVLGPRQALQWAVFVFVLAQVWIVFSYFIWAMPIGTALGWLLGLELGIALLQRSRQMATDSYVAWWVEGIPIYLLTSVLICRAVAAYL